MKAGVGNVLGARHELHVIRMVPGRRLASL